MIKFKILKKSKKSNARLGSLETAHGVVETPCFVPVATQAVLKTLTSEEAEQAKSQILISNTFHLHLKPGEDIVKQAGGLNEFMNWRRPLMTDSGGFQVFSLGFGSDFKTGKILSNQKNRAEILSHSQPQKVKITDQGVYFNFPLNGQKLFLGPKESIKIQEKLGADIIFAFDECPPPLASFGYVKKSLEKTHKWAEICLKTKKSKQGIYGIIQGSKFKQLRQESAQFISSLDFDGFGIGGEFGEGKKNMAKMLEWTFDKIQENKPRHLLGIGHVEDILPIIKSGVDTFDCVVPTRFARHNIVFTSKGKLDLSKMEFLKEKEPIDKNCSCFVCQNYKRNYISHLLRAKEITALRLMTFHNIYFFNSLVEKIRENIKNNRV